MKDDDPASSRRYEPPSVILFGTVFEPIEAVADGLAVRLTPAYFALPAEWRETVLRMLFDREKKSHPACRVLILYEAHGGKKIGSFSERGLEPSGS